MTPLCDSETISVDKLEKDAPSGRTQLHRKQLGKATTSVLKKGAPFSKGL